jgi:hypothetical protein
MSGRRGGVAVPLVTLVVSFLVVLALGGWLSTGRRGGLPPAGPSSSPTVEAVGIVIEGLTGRAEVLQPLPGLRVTVSPAGASKELDPSGGSRRSAVTVEICVSPGLRWAVEGDGWTIRKQNGEHCRTVRGKAGEIDPLEIRVRHQ